MILVLLLFLLLIFTNWVIEPSRPREKVVAVHIQINNSINESNEFSKENNEADVFDNTIRF